MSTDLATKSAATGSIAVRDMNDLERLGHVLASSGYFTDAREAAQCSVKVLAGLEMGFGAFASMSGIHLISGKPTISANLMAARVKNSGKYDYRVREMTPTVCRLEFFQGSESIGVSEFTIEDAKKAGTKNLDKFPRNMLFARAMSNGTRWYCPDVFLGSTVYTPEELGAETGEDGEVIDAPVQRHAPAARAIASEGVRVTKATPNPFAPTADAPTEKARAPKRVLRSQVDALIEHFERESMTKEDAAAFMTWAVGREVGSVKDLTHDEAAKLLVRPASEWADWLAEFAVDAAGGPPEDEEVAA